MQSLPLLIISGSAPHHTPERRKEQTSTGSALEGCEQVYTDKGYARPEAWAAMQAGVREVSIADTDAPVEYFNLQGVRVNEPTAGLYIRRQGRNVSKVIIM